MEENKEGEDKTPTNSSEDFLNRAKKKNVLRVIT
ncbi:uncharacterized protein G2W53_007798 [Senna tora]|uniref:Uncharacterized protein n=1 Tax=Senna tora TaxID=362788 RepID=A0A834WPL8_9FABA|nr:uncharacterized protein G2W53_012275 [Senna tora]KAF7839316.1 uncharacterized protein G2W53_007798 [Senna tora]